MCSHKSHAPGNCTGPLSGEFLTSFQKVCQQKIVTQENVIRLCLHISCGGGGFTETVWVWHTEGDLWASKYQWYFIPKCGLWYGGFWEHLIGLTKQAVKKMLGGAFITLLQLQTIVVEIEAMLNYKPLTYVYSDISDPEPLTLSHLSCGRRILVPHLFWGNM